MSDDEVRRAVEGPARYAGLEVEPDLLDAVVEDVRGRPGGLPLLSTALLDTWERRRGRTLTHAGYLAAGGVSGALARLADSAYARLAPASRRRRGASWSGSPTPARRGCRCAAGCRWPRWPRPAIRRRGAPLMFWLTAGCSTAGDDTVEVAHEALLSHWPQLARWLEEDEQGRALRRTSAPAAREWAQSGRPDAELYRGARLALAPWTGRAVTPATSTPSKRSSLRRAARRPIASCGSSASAPTGRHERASGRPAGAVDCSVALARVVALLLFSAVAGASPCSSAVRPARRNTAPRRRNAAPRRGGWAPGRSTSRIWTARCCWRRPPCAPAHRWRPRATFSPRCNAARTPSARSASAATGC